MNPPYHYTLPSGSRIFRATTIDKQGRWYTLSLEDAYTYGENITEYSTTKDLNLLNIGSLTFHNDFIDRLNVMYPDSRHTGLHADKVKCLVPLGLADIHSQELGINLLNANMPINTSGWNPLLDYSSKIMMNRHRLSEHSLDTHLVKVLEQIYGDVYDGYISPFEWPTKIHGRYFPKELCLFKIVNTIKEETTYKRSQVGGTSPDKNVKFAPLNLNIRSDKFIKFDEPMGPLRLFWNPHTDDSIKPSNIQPNYNGGKTIILNRTRRNKKQST
jgi:hypothetical protein